MEKLLKDLNNFISDLEKINYNCQKNKFKNKMEEFWSYVKSYDDKKTVELFLESESFKPLQKKFKRFEEYYERLIEVDESMIINAEILNNDEESLLSFAKNHFIVDNYKMVQKELEMLEKENIETLVMIGCGPLPETILFISDNTNISKIIGVDMSNEAIAMAGDIIKAMGLCKKVELVCSNGEDFDFSKADVVFVANATNNKNDLFKQISKTAKKGTEIILRNPYYLSNLVYKSLDKVPKNIFFKRNNIGDISSLLDIPSLYEVV
jgi:tRNA/tmRNA/rRNA uracil-C5-methylase (TrmA/RlmC/RlmD family)